MKADTTKLAKETPVNWSVTGIVLNAASVTNIVFLWSEKQHVIRFVQVVRKE
jgi:hypothetical protein